jgi:hypothetical protein
MSPDRIDLSVAEAREHSKRALRATGYDTEEARIIAITRSMGRCAATSIRDWRIRGAQIAATLTRDGPRVH